MLNLSKEQKELGSKLTKYQFDLVIQIVIGEAFEIDRFDAYKKAGGTAKDKKTAYAAVTRTLKNAKVKAFYDSFKNDAREKQIEGAVLCREEALEMLTNIARTKITDLVTFGSRVVGEDENGNKVTQAVWDFIDAEKLNDEAARTIAEVSTGQHGLKIKMHSQIDALAKICAMQGWEAPKKVDHGGMVGLLDMKIDPDTDPQKASEVYLEVIRGVGKASA